MVLSAPRQEVVIARPLIVARVSFLQGRVSFCLHHFPIILTLICAVRGTGTVKL